MIKAVIFDMDGLLIDSEPLWEETYVERLVNLGVPREEITKPEYKGLGVHTFFQHWYTAYPWGKVPTAEQLINESLTNVEQLVRSRGKALPGVISTIKALKAAGIPIAIASSSPMRLIETTADKLGIRNYFDYMHTGMAEDFAKPHPAVFIKTAKEMGIDCINCLVFEDALPGVIAAKAARMKCIAIPSAAHRADPRFCLADSVLGSMSDFTLSMLEEV